MGRPATPLQKLPQPDHLTLSQWRPSQHRPGPAAMHKVDDPDLYMEIMADSLLAGMADLQGREMPPLLLDDHPEAFWPTPGRCLWTWETLTAIAEDQGDPDMIPMEAMLNLALRPSSDYPDHLQGITPHFAALLTGMRKGEVVRAIGWLCEQGYVPNKVERADIYLALPVLPYGGGYDEGLDLLDLPYMPHDHLVPKRNSKRSPAQHLAVLTSAADMAMPEAIRRAPAYGSDLGPYMHSIFVQAVRRLREYAKEARRGSSRGDYDHLDYVWQRVETRDHSPLEPDAVRLYLTGEWQFHKLYSPELGTREHITLAIVRCMAQYAYRYKASRYQSASLVLGISLMSGISPAIFVRSNTALMQRTGMTFLSETHIDLMRETIRHYKPARSDQAQARRLDLVDELTVLLDEHLKAQDALDPTLVDDAYQLTNSKSFPAWGVHRSLHLGDEDDG